jgi:hypothetical protein
MIDSKVSVSGTLTARLIRGTIRAPLSWRLRNTLRSGFVLGWLAVLAAKTFSKLTGIPTITSELRALLIRADNTRVDYGIVSYRVVTDAGVAFLVDDWDNNGQDMTTMNYHGCGTGTNAEAVGDTALQTESTTILNPDSTRATGTRSQPAANQYRTVGTPAFDGAGAITEHGILSQSATGGGTLWDRSQFSAINVASGDSIQFTYTCTINSGG